MSKAYTQTELREIYQEYLAWFKEQTPEELRSRRACWNWAGEIDEDGNATGAMTKPEPYSFETWQLNDAAVVRVDELIQAVAVNKVKNAVKYSEWGRKVSLGNGEYADYSPEFARNYERGKEINARLANMPLKQAGMAMDSLRKEEDMGLGHLAAVSGGTVLDPHPTLPDERKFNPVTQKWSRLRWFINRLTGGTLCEEIGDVEESKSWLDIQLQKGAISPERAKKLEGTK